MARFNNGGSSTMVMELPSMTPTTNSSRPPSGKDVHIISEGMRTVSSSTPPPPEGQLPAPSTAVPQLARWNFPRINIYRFLATLWSFIILGANDAAYGALIPYLEQYYNINYTIVSLLFLSPTAGYVTSAITNNMMHVRFGQRGVGIGMALAHTVSYVIICLHPPYPVLVLACILAGYGNGLGDSAWNAWIGDMANPNELLGFLHAAYGLGATLAPLIATTLITKAGWSWYQYYYFMVGGAVIELITLTASFWTATGKVFREEHAAIESEANSGSSTPTTHLNIHSEISADTPKSRAPWYIRANPFRNPNSRTAEAVKNRVTIIASFFLLLYVGAEVTLGGWIVTFMLNVRHGEAFASGLTSTGFWLGITVGRLVLGFVTGRLFRSEKHAIAIYLIACVVLQLLFWLIPQFIVSAVMVGFLGFFLAPMFPAAVVAMTKLLPKRLHVASIGFAAALGASGACVFPFATGAIANAKGVQVLQPIVLAMLVATLGLWLLIPAIPKTRTQ